MKIEKKIAITFIALLMLFSLCSCGGSSSTNKGVAEQFVKHMIACDVDKAFSMLDGEAYLNYLFAKEYLIELANEQMKNTKMGDYSFYEHPDSDIVIIWKTKESVPVYEHEISYDMALKRKEFFAISVHVIKSGKELKIDYLSIPGYTASTPKGFGDALAAAAQNSGYSS